MQQHGSKYFTCRPSLTFWVWLGQNSHFSEHGHVSYQIKGNDACRKMVGNTFTHRPPSHPIKNSTFFRTWSCCMSNSTESQMQQHACTYSVITHTLNHWGGVKHFFLKVVMLFIKLKEMEHRAPCKHIFCP